MWFLGDFRETCSFVPTANVFDWYRMARMKRQRERKREKERDNGSEKDWFLTPCESMWEEMRCWDWKWETERWIQKKQVVSPSSEPSCHSILYIHLAQNTRLADVALEKPFIITQAFKLLHANTSKLVLQQLAFKMLCSIYEVQNKTWKSESAIHSNNI